MKTKKLRGGFTLAFYYYEHLQVLYEETLKKEDVRRFLVRFEYEINAAYQAASFYGDRIVVMNGSNGLYAQIQDDKNHFFPVD